jgi:hypothetical protein
MSWATAGDATGALQVHRDVTFVQMVGAAAGSRNSALAVIAATLRQPSGLEKKQRLGSSALRTGDLET